MMKMFLATWTIHRIVRDLLSAFSLICPFSHTKYNDLRSSSVDVREFQDLLNFLIDMFEELGGKTESLEEFNSMVREPRRIAVFLLPNIRHPNT